MSLWAPIVLIIVAMVAVVVFRGAAITHLARRGVPVTGRVIGKGKAAAGANRIAKPMVKVEYQGLDGRGYRRTFPISADEWEELQVGSEFEMFCLPERSNTSAPASVVLLARQSLDASGK